MAWVRALSKTKAVRDFSPLAVDFSFASSPAYGVHRGDDDEV
jgi:hypothetical protein